MAIFRIILYILAGGALAAIILLAVLIAYILKVQPQAKADWAKLKTAWATFQRILHVLWCYILIYLWWIRFFIRSYIVPVLVFVIFFVAGLFTCLDILFRFIEHFAHPRAWAIHPGRLGSFLAASKEAVGKFSSYPAVLVVLGFVEFQILFHHYHEFHRRNSHRITLTVLGQLLKQLSGFSAILNIRPAQAIVDQAEFRYRTAFADSFRRLLTQRGIRDVDICIMEMDSAVSKLKVVFESDPQQFDHTIVFGIGEGAAGKAFETGHIIYMPSIRYEHAIEVVPASAGSRETLGVLPSVYVQSRHPFKSMLCVPVFDRASNPIGVLNFSSFGRNAFTGAEFSLGTLAATVLGLMRQ